MFTDEQIHDHLTLRRELPNVECKGPGNLNDNPLFGRVVRAAMGMANRRDGGIVIIGVAECDQVLCPDGLTDVQMATWRYEDIADGLNKHAEPHISFEYQPCEWNGKKFLILHIHEFTDVPILCKKEYRDDSNQRLPLEKREKVLQKGLLYARSPNKPEAKEIGSVESMRAVLSLAIDKGIRRFVEQAQVAGISLSKDVRSRNDTLFREQREGWAGPLISDIQSRGYWEVIIRPEQFEQERIDFGQLYLLIQNSAVNLRTHSFPNTPAAAPPPGADWVSAHCRLHWIRETWRLYQSGQFIYLGGILDDWRDQFPYPSREGWKPGAVLSIEETVYRCTEFFEFASRLALAEAYRLAGDLRIDILLANLVLEGFQKRVLAVEPSKRLPIFDDFPTQADHIHYSRQYPKEELVSRPKQLALQAAMEIFKRFNWQPSEAYLQAIQSEIGQRS